MMYLTDAQAAEFFAVRRSLNRFVEKIADTPAEINENMHVILLWEMGPHAAGSVRMYDGIPRYCKQAHDSTGNPSWNPADATALWGHYHGTTPETARPFEADAANVYKVGEYATENGKIYRNEYDGNVYAPSVLPERWTYVRDIE